MNARKTFFNPEWSDPSLNPQWSPWLQAVEQAPNMARCTFCQRIFSLSNMGRQAIKSHMTSAKHVKIMSVQKSSESMKNFCSTSTAVDKTESYSSYKPNAVPSTSKSDLNSFVTKDNILEAELIWAMKLVCSHVSYNSFNDAALLFQKIFDDSEKAKVITLGRAKMSYLVSFGLAPYFRKQLISSLKDTEYVICFDEALNRIVQKNQMDLFVRFWDSVKEEVSTRYLTSIFLGHATASDLLKSFLEGTSDLEKKKLLQVSLDGPNVNIKFLRDLKDRLAEEDSCHLLDIGSCGLHVVHGAFRTGHTATNWNLNTVFKDMHRLFKDTPARRADYISLTGCKIFPLKFCEVRWCENISVAERAMDIFPSIKEYLEKSELPNTVTVERLKEAATDKLLMAKISFFVSVAGVVQPFLKTFQTADPVSPFLHGTFQNMLNQLLSKFIKRSILLEKKTPKELITLDLKDTNNYCSAAEVDVGVAAGAIIHKSNVSDLRKREFRTQCRTFLVNLTQKIMERSPFKYNLVKYISCLNPKFFISSDTLCQNRMEKLLTVLYENKWINSVTADKAKIQFNEILFRSKGMWKDTFVNYSNSRLDHFYRDLIMSDEEFGDLWKVIKLVLILSHGNATVESGFSVNNDMLVENLHEQSLIALRTVYHAVKTNGGVLNIEVTPEMLRYARCSRSAYHQALEDQKLREKAEKKEIDNKRKAKAEIRSLETKKQKLNKELSTEVKTIDAQIAELKKLL